MLRNKFVGIKTKLILAIVIILTLTTAFNLYFTYITFKTDKEAYIFEAAQRASQTAVEKITLKIEKIIENVNDLQKLTTSMSEESIKAVFVLNNKILKKLYLDENTVINNEEVINSVNQVLARNIEGLFTVKINNFVLIILNDKSNKIVKVALVDFNHDLDYFKKDPIFKYNIKIDTASEISDQSLNLNSIAKDFVGTKASENHLISRSINENYKIDVIAFIDLDKAYSVIEYILIKNIAFSLIILGLCLFITVLFSNKITKPIFQIIDKTRAIANGQYDTQLEVKTNDELKSLGKSVSSMSTKIRELLSDKEKIIKELEVANKKLDDYSKSLEVKVAERTAELSEANTFIKTIINSLDQGLFVFDNNNRIADIYTKACTDIFEQELSSKQVPEVLSLDGKDEVNFTKWSELIFANKIPFDSAKALGPKKYIKGSIEEDDFKHIELNYYPIYNDNDTLKNVVAVATDKTNEILAQESFKQKDDFVSMILKIIKNKTSFVNLITESKNLIEELINFDNNEKIIDKAMIVFHTLFGGLASFNIYELSKLARKNEDFVKSISKIDNDSSLKIKEIAQDYLVKLETFFQDTLSQIRSGENIVEIEKEDLDALKADLAKISTEAKKSFENIFEKTRIKTFFEGYKNLIETLSIKTDKPMHELQINDSCIRIDNNKYNEFFSTLIHLFRNCMDHGIENSSKRNELGKDSSGLIKIDAKEIGGKIEIVVSDDGAGINTEKVKKKLIEILGEDKVKNMSEKDINMAIFLPSLSTADELTELSGRGVGMSAIKEAIDKMGGELDLITSKDLGSQFVFLLPKL